MGFVYNYGMITASTVYVLDTSFDFPQPNQYAEISETLSSVGGEAANTAIMLSKLGIKTKLDGNWLNKKNAKQILDLLKTFDIDTTQLTIDSNFGTEEIVIVDKNNRTIFGNFAQMHKGKKLWNPPYENFVKQCSMVALDPYFHEDSEQMAKLCIQHRKPYVTFDCTYTGLLAQKAESIIISHELRDRVYIDDNPTTIFYEYLNHCQGLVIFTFGSEPLWYGRKGGPLRTFTPYQITPIDTTGAGDSFRAGIIFGLLHKWDDKKTIEFASAVAANVCLTRPHTLNAPDLNSILEFILQHKKK